jgi:tRNA(Met) C34 N-acetyltransferase TmcA
MSRIPSRYSSRLRTSGIREYSAYIWVGRILNYYRYYKESHKILGNTYGMLVLQDFEAITPNLLARTIETVEGGGVVVLLLKTMSSLRQLYTMTMVGSYQ